MKLINNIFVVVCVMRCLIACQNVEVNAALYPQTESLFNYQPKVIKNGQSVLSPTDKEDCINRLAKDADLKSSRSASQFRQCLIDKGYTLID